jgi:hypothetical protein
MEPNNQQSLPLKPKGYTQKEFIKKVLMISIGLFTIGGIVAFAFDGLTSTPYDQAVRERNKIEVEMKLTKQEIDRLEIELTAKKAELETQRTQRQAATDQINNWINEGLEQSQ